MTRPRRHRTVPAALLGLLLPCLLAGAQGAGAQERHQEHEHGRPAERDPERAPHPPGPAQSDEPAVQAATSMVRQPAGTSWQPDETPHDAIHWSRGEWSFGAHYLLFGGYGAQNGPRGDSARDGMGWGMLMAQKRFDRRVFGARIMLSPEPVTAGGRGYPLLLQSGEAFHGEPLHDRQHPHDLFMEIAATLTSPIGRGWFWQIYAAPAGEPALGPLAAPHRLSAAFDPHMALGHHWIDSSHISFGVLTAGAGTDRCKVEASWFNGREPDDARFDFDFRRPDSRAVRVTMNPAARWSGQISYGFLESPEELEPEESVRRVTASVLYHRETAGGHWATTAAFGRNNQRHASTDAILLESSLDLDGRNVLFGRAELVEKTGHDLVLPDPSLEHESFPVRSLALGYLRQLPEWRGMQLGIGARMAVNPIPDRLAAEYGSSAPRGGMIFLRLAPAPGRTPGEAHH